MAFDPKGTVRAVIAVGKGLIALGFHEVRQDVVVAPALISAATPFVVVTAISADVDHVIDGARSAEHPALRDKDSAPIQMRLGKSSVSPVIGAVLETSIECRYPDRGLVIPPFPAARFDILQPPMEDHVLVSIRSLGSGRQWGWRRRCSTWPRRWRKRPPRRRHRTPCQWSFGECGPAPLPAMRADRAAN